MLRASRDAQPARARASLTICLVGAPSNKLQTRESWCWATARDRQRGVLLRTSSPPDSDWKGGGLRRAPGRKAIDLASVQAAAFGGRFGLGRCVGRRNRTDNSPSCAAYAAEDGRRQSHFQKSVRVTSLITPIPNHRPDYLCNPHLPFRSQSLTR